MSDGRVTGTGLTARRDNSAEVLVAASQGGDYVLIDTRDGRASRIGSYGPVTGSSGDQKLTVCRPSTK